MPLPPLCPNFPRHKPSSLAEPLFNTHHPPSPSQAPAAKKTDTTHLFSRKTESYGLLPDGKVVFRLGSWFDAVSEPHGGSWPIPWLFAAHAVRMNMTLKLSRRIFNDTRCFACSKANSSLMIRKGDIPARYVTENFRKLRKSIEQTGLTNQLLVELVALHGRDIFELEARLRWRLRGPKCFGRIVLSMVKVVATQEKPQRATLMPIAK